MANVISWFEIPAKDFKRACSFYGHILDGEIQPLDYQEGKMGFLPGTDQDNVGGAIIYWEGYEPSDKGTCVYLNGGDDLNKVLNKVEKAGGKVMMAKTDTGGNGFTALFMDTEGNKVGLHSPN
jgi:uncharacterized protein